jgi:arabinogalactan oligomer/maltooligosaccharide transport system permease protein
MRRYWNEIKTAWVQGNLWTRLSLLVMGSGYCACDRWGKGILMTLMEVFFFLFTGRVSWQYIRKLNTLGTVQRKETLDLTTLQKTVNHYDNSLLILLFGVVGILIIAAFVALYVSNFKTVFRMQQMKEHGEHINTMKEDCREPINRKFHVSLLALPVLGVILVNVIPIIFMICVAFTNYDMDHQPPTYLFTWVGLKNFRQLFTSSATVTFGYAFIRILFWTLLWALLATFSTYFGGIMLAKLINDRQVRWKKMWRTLFVITIAIPQFVTLLLVGKMFGDYGIVNSICSKTGLTDLLRQIGLVGKGLSYIPFLTKPGWAHVMIVLINIWVGVPFQMLSATGILMNIPHEQMESAKIDGANERQIFWKITMPYMLFVTGPSLLTALIANINNFNVIYLLTTDYVTSNMNYANSNAKEVDLLVTWLFRLTNDYSNYKMASVIGICVFCICAVLTLIGFTRMIAGNKEEEFQ